MRKLIYAILALAGTFTANAQETNELENSLYGLGISATPVSQMEKLDRGLVVVPSTNSKKLVSWRRFGYDDPKVTFDLYKNGVLIDSMLTVTNRLVSSTLSRQDEFQVVARVDGVEVDRSKVVTGWSDFYYPLPINRPKGGSTSSGDFVYNPNDCSVGDVDGDGEYEIILKWDPSNSKDNSQSGFTGETIFDCYKLDGTQLWRINMGLNIRSGAHYTPFLVYDFDGDGKAEMICKTGPGTKDGNGKYVSAAATDERIQKVSNLKVWTTGSGWIDGGYELLTVFNGETGAAVHTIPYMPNRNGKFELSDALGTLNWYDSSSKTDNHGYNRGERYLATVAYLGGPDENPSAVMCRGYYTFAHQWAVDFDGKELKTRWISSSVSNTEVQVRDAEGNVTKTTHKKNTSGRNGHNTMYANGNHNLSAADVDGDGRDEIIFGSATLDDNGSLLYAVGYGHGDAMHVSDLDPTNPGLEVFQVHEESPYGWSIHDARTGKVLHSADGSADNGRGVAADIARSRGFEFWSAKAASSNPFSCITGKEVLGKKMSMNFRIYWDGDLYDELLDNVTISKADPVMGTLTTLGVGTNTAHVIANMGNPASCNSTKATPNLSADIFGDWREELILWDSSDASHLNIYSTATETNYSLPTLMHDHVYRLGIAWQNSAYNQPPHLGFSPIEYMNNVEEEEKRDVESILTDDENAVWTTISGIHLNVKPAASGIYIMGDKKIKK